MRSEDKKAYAYRISNSNATGIIAILFDIFDADVEEAILAYESGEKEKFIEETRHASLVVSHLQEALDFKYDLSKELYPIYDFVKRSLAKSMYKDDLTGINEAITAMGPIGESFRQVAKEDNSMPVMENAQQVTAGMTYGRGQLNETVDSESRGFLA